ncbi:MAG: hypothetical protein H7837_09755 [Magnetococcus sp. MYC-9]
MADRQQPSDKEGEMYRFPETVMARYRLAQAMRETGEARLAVEYLDLLRLKEELELFIWDIVVLDRGQHILYAVDDVCLSAYVEMNPDNRRSFSFPVVQSPSPDVQLDRRAIEYASRLQRLLFPIGDKTEMPPPLLILPSAMPGLLKFSAHLIIAGNKQKGRIEFSLNQITTEDPQTLKAALDQLSEQLRSAWPSTSPPRGTEANKASAYLQEHLYALYQLLWNSEQTKKQIEIFERVLNQSNLCYLHAGLFPLVDALKSRFPDRSESMDLFGQELEPIFNTPEAAVSDQVEMIFRLLMETDWAAPHKKKPEALWSTAANVGYLSAINQTLEKQGIHAVVQLVTHRQKLANAVRALGWDKKGVPVRHPKFLAAALHTEQRQKVVGLANKVVVCLERMMHDVDDIAKRANRPAGGWSDRDNERVRQAIKVAQGDIEKPWISMKSGLYLDDAIVPSDTGPDRQAQGADFNSLLQRIRDPAALQELSSSSVDYEGEYLVHQILVRWTRGQKVYITLVPAFESAEMAHLMITPLADKMRYIIKIPEDYFDAALLDSLLNNDKVRRGEAFAAHTIEDVVNALHRAERCVRRFTQAFCAAVTGNWSLVEQLLQEQDPGELASLDVDATRKAEGLMDRQSFLIYEGFYLRQFGLRGSAARATGDRKWIALSHLNDAGGLLDTMLSVARKDFRYRLARIGWNLHVLVALAECGEVNVSNPRLSGQYPYFKEISSAQDLARECLDIISVLSNNLRAPKESFKPVQSLYWEYMRGRAHQMLLMIIATTEANLVPGNTAALFAMKHRISSGKSIYDRAKEGMTFLPDALKKLAALTPDGHDCEALLKRYPSATFLNKWFELQYADCASNKNPGVGALSELKNTRRCLDGVLGILEDLESSCRELSLDGFPRRVFRHLKAIEYRRQRQYLLETLHGSLERLEQEAIRSYQTW